MDSPSLLTVGARDDKAGMYTVSVSFRNTDQNETVRINCLDTDYTEDGNSMLYADGLFHGITDTGRLLSWTLAKNAQVRYGSLFCGIIETAYLLRAGTALIRGGHGYVCCERKTI